MQWNVRYLKFSFHVSDVLSKNFELATYEIDVKFLAGVGKIIIEFLQSFLELKNQIIISIN